MPRTFSYVATDMSNLSNLFDECIELYGGEENNDASLRCISEKLQVEIEGSRWDTNKWFLIYSAALIFFMQAGFAMLCAGSVRMKNVQNTMLKNLLDACGAALGFFSVGYAFAFGGQFDRDDTTFIGSTNFFMMNVDNESYWLFQFAFAATAATIVAGTLAERCQMIAYLCYSVLLTGFVYPVVAHSIWSNNGFLSPFNKDPFLGVGMIDFAGSGVVHTTGGITALFATLILGPRKGRFYDNRGNPLRKPTPFPGHSVALQMLGTFILWFGWYGFNPGSALTISNIRVQGEVASHAAVNTTLSAASGCVVALFCNLIIKERLKGEAEFDLIKAMNGSLAGLVAITAGCSVVEPWASVVIGATAGFIYLGASKLLIIYRLDDAVDAIPVHLFNGVWGVLAVGFFASPIKMAMVYENDDHVGWFYSWSRGSSDASLLACQVCGILFICGWVVAIMFPFFIWLNYLGWFRADSLEELVGLDISYHGGSASNSEDVKSEYMEAFRRQKQLRQRRGSRQPQSGTTTIDEENGNGPVPEEIEN
mmetsp:Transcript_4116/g.6025  ORF Transcript_4116/g.6025 Transcript_4116/m.6025 type:complete len:537 (-) Transcript_4116:80-1690(-)